jgi:parallel beta-helix repeat protein
MLLKRIFSGILLGLLLLCIVVSAFNIQPVRAEGGTIYIRADGSIDPPTAPIKSVCNVTYTFTDSIYDQIVIERSNTIIDGNGYILQGYDTGIGFSLFGINNVTVKNTNIQGNVRGTGIYLGDSSNCTISENNVTSNYYGVFLASASYKRLYWNNVTNNNDYGIYLWFSSYNVLRNSSMMGNRANFGVDGSFIQDVDAWNTLSLMLFLELVFRRQIIRPFVYL